ncbi:hypothetical protein GGR75_003761 [Xanthomonas campestris]|nr:hypothetical protein [Xanthomonas campestris]
MFRYRLLNDFDVSRSRRIHKTRIGELKASRYSLTHD